MGRKKLFKRLRHFSNRRLVVIRLSAKAGERY